MRNATIIGITLFSLLATAAQAEIAIDSERGVLGTTQEKRDWITTAMTKALGKGRKLQVAQHQL
ncbi:MAG: hypothetical protein ACI9G1_001420, partial [Pirellulaceae bacterium]